MTAAPALPAAKNRPIEACAGLARAAGLESLALRIAELTPALTIFGPAGALVCLLTAALSDLRWTTAA